MKDDNNDATSATCQNNNDETPRELRRAVQYAVMSICGKEEEVEDDDNNVIGMGCGSTMTAPAITALSELVYLYATTSLGRDLAAFSLHANRKTINVDDVKLVARKNPDILQKLEVFCSSSSDNCTNGLAAANKHVAGRNPKQQEPILSMQSSSDDESGMDNEASNNDFQSAITKARASKEGVRKRLHEASTSARLETSSDSSMSDGGNDKEKAAEPAVKKMSHKNKRNDETIKIDDSSSCSSNSSEEKSCKDERNKTLLTLFRTHSNSNSETEDEDDP